MESYSLIEEAKKKILILDGAMGTMIQAYKLSEADYRSEKFKDFPNDLKGNNDLLSITQPQIIKEIHSEYLAAGADLIETNTFNTNSISMADYDMEAYVYEINYQAAKIAKEAAIAFTEKEPHKPRFVLGSIGPTTKTASLSPDVNNPGYRAVNFDDLAKAYREQCIALIEGGVDALLVETIFDTLNAKAALFAISGVFEELNLELPIMVSGTITDASGRTLSGQTAEAFLISMSHLPLFSIGFNCALGADQLRPYLQIIARESEFNISAHPNAGLPNAFGDYEQSPEEMAELIREYLELELINVIGGCCGTSPEHIRAIAETAEQFQPRKINHKVES